MAESIKSQAISGVKWSAVSKFYTSGVSVVQIAVLTRFLAKDDFGLMGIAVLVNSFCAIFMDMGMSTAAMHEQNLSKNQFSSFYWFNLVSGFFLAVVVSASSPLIATYYHRDELVNIISLTSISIFINSLYSLQRTIQQKQMNFRFMSLVDVLTSTISFVANTFLAIQGFGVLSLVWSQLLAGSIGAVCYLLIAIFKERNIQLHFSFKEIHIALKIGIYQVGIASLDFFSREMDSFIISSYMPMEVFGVYTLCKNLTMRIYMVVNPIITNVLTPIFAKLQETKDRLSAAYVRTVELLGYVNFPIYGIVAVASYSIITILYGSTYSDYAFVMAAMAVFYAFQSCGNPIGSLIIATGRTDRGFYWTIFRIIFTFIYLNIASHFELNSFMVFIMLTPILTAYPSWYLILRVISDIGFKEAFMLQQKPFLTCVPLFPLFFLDRWIDFPFVSAPVVALLFLAGYYLINYYFRPQLQKYMVGTLLQSIKIKK